MGIGRIGDHQRHARRQVQEIAPIKLEVRMDRPKLQFVRIQQLCDAPRLGAGKGEVQLSGNALLKHVKVLGKGQDGLHHVQVVHDGRVDAAEALCQEVRLLLVVPLKVHAVPWTNHRLQERHSIVRLDDLAAARNLRRLRQAPLRVGLQRVPSA